MLKIKQWWIDKKIEDKKKDIHRISQAILSLLVNKENELTHVEQSEILNDVIQKFKERKKQESINCHKTILDLESAISKLC